MKSLKTKLIGRVLVLLWVGLVWGVAGEVRFQVTEAGGNPVPCRIRVVDEKGKHFHPEGAPFWRGGFVCDGKAVIQMPPGRYRYVVERGPEWTRDQGEFEVEEKPVSVSVNLKHFVDLEKEGWYGGDLHVHRALEEIPLHMKAEDLQVASVQTTWNKTNPWGNQIVKDPVRGDGGRNYHVISNEDERGGGALLYHRMNRAIDLSGSDKEWPPSSLVLERAKEHGAWAEIEKPFWWDTPLWLSTGKIDSIGIAHNHMNRSEVLDNEAWGRPRDLKRYPGVHGNGLYTQDLYYRILNCGLRVSPSAGSASGVLPNPVGYNRVYVYPGDSITWDRWWEGLRQGRCFVTNGPLLRLTANGSLPGEVFESDQPLKVRIEGRVDGNDKIEKIELIRNGEIRVVELPVEFEVSESGWFLVRAIADVKETFRFASTAPWYVEIGGKKMVPDRKAATFLLNWAKERRANVGHTVSDPQKKKELLEIHDRGIAYWKTLQEHAPNPWPMVEKVDAQPLLLLVDRIAEALESIGEPLDAATLETLRTLRNEEDEAKISAEIQRLFDPSCLLAVEANENSGLRLVPGQQKPVLFDNGWRNFLIKVVNPAGARGGLRVDSQSARPIPNGPADEVDFRWIELNPFIGRPLAAELSGLGLEYRILQIYAKPGTVTKEALRPATLEFSIDGLAGTASPVIRQWRFEKDTAGWGGVNQCELEVRDGSLFIKGTGSDPFLSTPVDARGGKMVLRFWAHSEEEGVGQFFWWGETDSGPTPAKTVNFQLLGNGTKEYVLEFEEEGRLAGLRLDPNGVPCNFRIDWIDLEYAPGTGSGWEEFPTDWKVEPSTPVTFQVRDADGSPAMGCFIIKDQQGRIYPPQTKRVAPDFFFQAQVYRESGEVVNLPPGKYTFTCSRGPESIPEVRQVTVGTEPLVFDYTVKRWIDTAKLGYWSGDHHIHAAGCLHYTSPTEGVHPGDMLRHIMGEDCKVGCCLTWGPCFDFQKQFFTGKPDDVSRYPYILRYDIEVSGFGSHAAGHLNLLDLTQQIPEGGDSMDHWPTLGMNTLRWAKAQGAVTGTAHSGHGLMRSVGRTPGEDGPHQLPNFNIPAHDGIGACEFVVQVTHKVSGPDGKEVPAIDFIATMNTPREAEWNMWYHVLNCGFPVVASGETDFPCMSGERVAMGRVYVQLEGKLDYERWVRNLQLGKSYVSDGRAHLMNFEKTGDGKFKVKAAAMIADKEEVPIELIVNGRPVETQSLKADGSTNEVMFNAPKLDRSSWVAVRIHPHAHTNPINVLIDGKPIRASRNSAQWCLTGVEQCWKEKSPSYAPAELAQAQADYDHARKVYQKIIEESEVD